MSLSASFSRGKQGTRGRGGAAIAVFLLALVGWLGTPAARGQTQENDGDKANPFQFKIDPRTPLRELLPTAPDASPVPLPWLVQDLRQVPEVLFQKPEAVKWQPPPKPTTQEEQERALVREQEEETQALVKTAQLI